MMLFYMWDCFTKRFWTFFKSFLKLCMQMENNLELVSFELVSMYSWGWHWKYINMSGQWWIKTVFKNLCCNWLCCDDNAMDYNSAQPNVKICWSVACWRILNWIFGMGLYGLDRNPVVGSTKHVNDPLDTIKYLEFLY
jgi:hypothetical protein